MAWTVFIDGKEGTTGLRIFDRLAERGEFSLLTLPEEKRKDPTRSHSRRRHCHSLPAGRSRTGIRRAGGRQQYAHS